MWRCRLWLGGEVTHHARALLPGSHRSSASCRPIHPWFHTHESIYWLTLSTSRPHYRRGHVTSVFLSGLVVSFVRRPGGWQPPLHWPGLQPHSPMPLRSHRACRGSPAWLKCPCPVEKSMGECGCGRGRRGGCPPDWGGPVTVPGLAWSGEGPVRHACVPVCMHVCLHSQAERQVGKSKSFWSNCAWSIAECVRRLRGREEVS